MSRYINKNFAVVRSYTGGRGGAQGGRPTQELSLRGSYSVSAYIKCIPKFVAKFVPGETLRPLSSQQHLSRPRLRQMLVRAFTRELTAGCVVGVELMGLGELA